MISYRYTVTCTDMSDNRDFEFDFVTPSWDMERNRYWQVVATGHLNKLPDYNPDHSYTLWSIYYKEEVNA